MEREYFQPVPGDGIYLMGCRFPEAQWSGLYHSYICRYSFDTGELEELAEFDCEEGRYYHMMNYTSSYILVEYNEIAKDGQYTYSLFLYDYAGNLVLTQDLGEHYFSYLMGGGRRFYLRRPLIRTAFLSRLFCGSAGRWGDRRDRMTGKRIGGEIL